MKETGQINLWEEEGILEKTKVENQAGERAGVTECPRLLSHRRATPVVTAFVSFLELNF